MNIWRIILAIVTMLGSSCARDGWHCMARPTVGQSQDGKAVGYGFDVRCGKRF